MSQNVLSTEQVLQTRIPTVDRQPWFDVHRLRLMFTGKLLYMEKDNNDYRGFVHEDSGIVDDA